MNNSKIRIPLVGGWEYDCLTKARKYYRWKSGTVKRVKLGYNRRLRKYLKHQDRLELGDGYVREERPLP